MGSHWDAEEGGGGGEGVQEVYPGEQREGKSVGCFKTVLLRKEIKKKQQKNSDPSRACLDLLATGIRQFRGAQTRVFK